MIRLHTLGGLDVRLAADDRSVHSVLAQPKRTGLLVFLAVLRGRETRRRDALLSTFWPESDMQRSRNSLNQALHYLRRSLGEDLIVSRGDEEVGLAKDAVWCDAMELEEALGRGDRERALELYRGEFLDGFFVEGAPDFERWADEERGRFRRLAVTAAQELAESAIGGTDAAAGERWLRRVLEIEPFNAGSVYQLIELLAARGERARALELAEDYRDGLKREFDATPSEELERLIETLRTAPAAAPAARQAVETAARGAPPSPDRSPTADPPPPLAEGTPDAAAVRSAHPGPAPAQPGAPAGDRRRHPRPALRHAPLLLIAALVLVLAAGLWAWRGDDAPAPIPSDRRIAVFPFSFRGSSELAYLGEGASSLLTTGLDEREELSTIDSHALLAAVRRDGAGAVSPRAGAELARELGAGLFVLGDIVEISDQIRLQAALYRADADGGRLIARGWVQGRTDDVFVLVDELAPQLGAAATGDSIP